MGLPSAWAGLLALALLPGCGRVEDAPAGEPTADAAPLVAFDTARVWLVSATDSVELRVELAEDGDQRAMGLMERTALAADAGMLFTYAEPQAADAGFWMYRTRIPLDIAFLDPAGRIVAIRAMEPCASPQPRWCPTYAPGVPYRAALEVNRGFFQRHGVAVGDRVRLPGRE